MKGHVILIFRCFLNLTAFKWWNRGRFSTLLTREKNTYSKESLTGETHKWASIVSLYFIFHYSFTCFLNLTKFNLLKGEEGIKIFNSACMTWIARETLLTLQFTDPHNVRVKSAIHPDCKTHPFEKWHVLTLYATTRLWPPATKAIVANLFILIPPHTYASMHNSKERCAICISG